MAGGALLRYKLRGLYRRNRRLSRRVRQINKFKRLFQTDFPPGVNNATSVAMFGADKAAAQNNPRQYAARQAMRYWGPGDYRTGLRYLSRGIGGLAGGAMGYMQGGFAGLSGGAKSGWDQGAAFSKFMGWGDYTSTNQIMDGGAGTQQQIAVNQSDLSGDIYVQRTEFVQNIVASGTGLVSTFNPVAFPLNPGLSNVFPFLSQIAQNFELYEFAGLMFQYKPLFSENAGTASNLGKVIFATNYDPNASAFINSVQMENFDYANSTKPSCGLIHGVETKNSQQFGNMQYVRTGATSRDKIFTDIGQLFVATEGVPLPGAGVSVVIGELWVTYYIKLSRAQLFGSQLGFSCAQDMFSGTSSAAQLFNTLTLSKSTNQIGCVLSAVSPNSMKLTFPVNINLGSYFICAQFVSGGTVFTTQGFANPTGLTNLQCYIPGGAAVSGAGTGVGGPFNAVGSTSNSNIFIATWVQVNSPGLLQASIILTVSAALTNTTTWNVWVMQCNQNPSVSLT